MEVNTVSNDHDLLIEIHRDVRHIRNCIDDHEIRLRVLERQHNQWLGRDGAIVSSIAIVVSTLVTAISWLANWVMR